MPSLARRLQKRIMKRKGTDTAVELRDRTTDKPLVREMRLPGQVEPLKVAVTATPLFPGQEYRYNG